MSTTGTTGAFTVLNGSAVDFQTFTLSATANASFVANTGSTLITANTNATGALMTTGANGSVQTTTRTFTNTVSIIPSMVLQPSLLEMPLQRRPISELLT
jgi:hypothetical protein